MDGFFPFCRSFTSLCSINRKNRVFVNVEMKNLMIFSYFLLSIELWTEQTLFLKIDKISKAGCKKRGLMQYKCMEKEIRKLHGRILFPICHVYRDNFGRNAALTERNHESLYTGSRFSPPAPLAPGKRNGFCRFVKNMITHRKSTDTIPCSMSPHSRTTRAGLTQDFPVI